MRGRGEGRRGARGARDRARSPRRVVFGERLAAPDPLAVREIAAGVDDEAVEPGGELALAAELAQALADLEQRFLGGVTRILDVAEQWRRKRGHFAE